MRGIGRGGGKGAVTSVVKTGRTRIASIGAAGTASAVRRRGADTATTGAGATTTGAGATTTGAGAVTTGVTTGGRKCRPRRV